MHFQNFVKLDYVLDHSTNPRELHSGVARIRSYGGPLLKFCLTRKDGVQVYKLWNTTKIKRTYKPRKIEDYSFCNVEFSYITYP